MFNYKFYCRASQIRKDGTAPLELYINDGAKIKYLSLGVKYNPKAFKDALKSKKINEIKRYVISKEAEIQKIITNIEQSNLPLNVYQFEKALTEGLNKRYYSFLDVYNEVLQMKENEGKSKSTTSKYKIVKEEFLKIIGFNEDDDINNIKNKDIKKYENFVLQNYQSETSAQRLKKLKAIFRYALENGYIKINPFLTMTIHVESKEKDFLTYEEVQLIAKTDYHSERLNKVRDLMIFQSFSGLAYTDLANLTKDDIQLSETGVPFIKKKRVKSKIEYTAIIFDKGKEVLKKYENDISSLVISNQKYNSYIKEILANTEGLEINGRKISCHSNRHFYGMFLANLKDDYGTSYYNTREIQTMMGHTSQKQALEYQHMLDKTLFEIADNVIKDEEIRNKPKRTLGFVYE